MKAYKETIDYGFESRILSVKRKEKEFPFAWHFHDAYEITLISQGRGQRFVGNNIAAYDEGDLVLLPPHIPHSWQSDPTSKVNEAYVIQFNENCLGDSFHSEDFREIKNMLSCSAGLRFKTNTTLSKKIRAFHDCRGIKRIIEFLEFLSELNDSPRSVICTAEYNFSPEKNGDEKLDAIMEYLNNLSGEAPNIPQLSSNLGMSESTFRRFIKRYTGKSLIKFYNEMCINKACKLLLETNDSISDICLNCGYRNLSHFNRVFKDLIEMTPREIRDKSKK